ncbi:MAG: nucleoside diphosphate kinase regulator [Thiobacillus sp.]|jgi:regulator of nucleoside diphosphate kinase|uniref:nucleoside diphosphate kinase regulator n=1 Tax=Thiobacillus sp. TaxID=924 RepID=UPI002894ABE1|nr:nucleoside diphosphate kinase regulator [Thiobacillus sp.]MDT3707125.1 nucleoside diphosphate kinase regulator [Thiobacillus sp.]
MEITTRPAIIVSEPDLERLEAMLASLPDTHPGAEALREELDRAQILPAEEMPADVVTMNSRIRFVVEPAGKEVEVDLVYPRDLTGLPDQLSVTTPAGIAVLGLAVGQQIEWLAPNGQAVRARIVDVTYQPERSGDFMR